MGKYDHLDRDALVRLLERRDAERQLGLVWERDELDPDAARNDDFIALEHDEVLSHGDAPWRNLIIEGDNYDALRALRMSHAGRIRCIYIDPPYNTGNRDFVYNDRFVDKTHRFRHSLWLEFMHQRLTLARELLADDGVIFVSIDDNELFRLGMLMDRVFGEDKRIGTLLWQTRTSPDSRNTTGLSVDHEYVLCYGSRLIGRNVDIEKFDNPDNDERGPWRSADMTGLATKQQRPNLHYDLRDPATSTIYPCPPKGWRYEQGTMQRLIEEQRVLWPSNKNGRPRLKKFLADLRSLKTGFSSFVNSPTTSQGSRDTNEILGSGVFSFPKPFGLIQELVAQVARNDGIVLDFFAGSGTTAHAVAKLNTEDGGTRRFILVSSTEATADQPDKNLCRDVCAERVRRVLGGYTNAKGETVPGLGGGFAYLRTRRIAPYRLATRINHDEVWRALELIHDRPLLSWQNHGFQHDDALGYLADFRAASLDRLRTWLGNSRGAGRTLYAWNPSRIADLAPEADLAPIPDFLRVRFGR